MHRQLSKLFILILTGFILGMSIVPAYGEKTDTSPIDPKSEVKEEAPKYIKHVVVIALDGFEQKYFTASVTPRLVGISKEGISGKVIDNYFYQDRKSQHQVLVDELLAKYRVTQRKSLLVNGCSPDRQIDIGFSTALNIGKDDLDNPKKIINAAITQFQKEQPYLTYITIAAAKNKEDNEKKNHFKTIDEAIGQFMEMLQQQGLYDYTMLVVVGRNSAQNITHTDIQTKDFQIEYPLGIRGPNLNAGLKIPSVYFENIPATIFYLTDGKELNNNGKVLWNIIKTDNYYVVQELLRKRIKDITNERDYLIRQQVSWSIEKINVSNQQKVLTQERKGIQKQLSIRDATIKLLKTKLKIYSWLGLGIICTFLFGYAVQYYLLRKRFLLF